MGKVNKFHCWLSLTSLDIRITWRFEIKNRKPKKASFIGLREELSQTILREVSVLNWSYSKQWIRVQWRTGRDNIVLRNLNMKNFSGARLAIDVSIHKNRLQGAVTSTGMIVIVVIFCLSAFPFPFCFSKC